MIPIHQILTTVDGIVWGPFMIVLLSGTGVFLTFRLRGLQARKLVYAFLLIKDTFHLPGIATGLLLALIVGLVVIGGIKRHGYAAGNLIPFMATL